LAYTSKRRALKLPSKMEMELDIMMARGIVFKLTRDIRAEVICMAGHI